MSKKKVGSYDHQVNTNAMYSDEMVLTFSDNYLSHIQGKVLTLIEALVEIETDEKKQAIKSLVNDAIWGDMHNGWAVPANEDDWLALTLEG